MSYPRILQKVFAEPWLITAEAHLNIQRLLQSRLAETYAPPKIETTTSAPAASDRRMPDHVMTMFGPKPAQYYQLLPGGIARINSVRGIIGKRITAMELDCGACSLDHYMHAVDLALADEQVRSVVIDFDSPGGVSIGVAEAARHTAAAFAATDKTVVGFVETVACSAAQWLLAACPLVVATPSAWLGSIGAYSYYVNRAHDDEGGLLFQAGKYKAAGLRELSEEEIEMKQAELDRLHADFKAAIWEHRPDVPESAMEGQVIEGRAALDLGLADLLVDTFEDMVAQLGLAGD